MLEDILQCRTCQLYNACYASVEFVIQIVSGVVQRTLLI